MLTNEEKRLAFSYWRSVKGMPFPFSELIEEEQYEMYIKAKKRLKWAKFLPWLKF